MSNMGWTPHIQVIRLLNFCHLSGATEPQLQESQAQEQLYI